MQKMPSEKINIVIALDKVFRAVYDHQRYYESRDAGRFFTDISKLHDACKVFCYNKLYFNEFAVMIISLENCAFSSKRLFTNKLESAMQSPSPYINRIS